MDNPKILVVDDDPTTRMLAARFLGAAGFEIHGAEDGEVALNMLSEVNPDLLLLDVEMPQLDGFDTCTQLRDIPEHAKTPILMVTGLEDTQSIEKAYAVGATDFTTKPLNWTILPHRLRYLLRSSAAMNELAATNKELATTKTSLVTAQRIARIGSWEWQIESDHMMWSEHLFALLGLEPDSVAPSLDVFLNCLHSGDRDRVATWLTDVRNDTVTQHADYRILMPDGSERHIQHLIEVVSDTANGARILYATLQDVTEKRRTEQKIHQLAYSDSLTSLPNREAFRERLHQALSLAQRHQRTSAILFLDLDDFKRVNDTLGHTVGDLLLQAVAQRLLTSVRDCDVVTHGTVDDLQHTVARLGGDEFTILLADIDRGESAATVAQRVLDALSETFHIATHEVFISPSIGVALFPQDGDDAETLLKNADVAMYAAKRSGKNLYRFFDDSLNESTIKRLKIDTLLRKALGRGELSLHYQPQMDLSSGDVVGVEALIRWHNPEFGSVSPEEFIPLAEENGQIVPIGEWVLNTACAQARRWIDEGFPLSRVAVNISVIQFVRPDFTDVVAKALAASGLAPAALELEITESLLAKDVSGAVRTLRALKDIGVQLSIDDFGTGYSSLSQLKHFPIDRLKIDRSFVRDVISDHNDAAITLAVIGMAQTMNLDVVAEGVETEAQMRFLETNRCNEVQGFHLSRPLPAKEMALWLRKHQNLGLRASNE